VISKETYTKEWLRKIQKLYRGKDPILIEKITRAFALLEQLKLKGLDFIFKGGSSLLLLLKEINRFSIDIILPRESKQTEKIFDDIIKDGLFSGYEEDRRGGAGDIPKSHFKFYYNSLLTISRQNALVLLDVLYEENPYAQTVSVPVESPFIGTEPPGVEVVTPDINCILGDKLTAFAPNTTGIPYSKGKSLEIIKQLYDIGRLFDHFDNITGIEETFTRIASQELEYRELNQLTINHVLDDIFDTAAVISFRGPHEKECYEELSDGVRKIIHYIYSEHYRIEEAISSAAKAAYLSRLLKSPGNQEVARFDKNTDLSRLTITHPQYTKFNKIKKYKPETFFYWYEALKIHDK
jgi:hypothetical protein